MEIEGLDGSTILVRNGIKEVFGRGLGFPSDDRTVSRRHVSFELDSTAEKDVSEDFEPRVSFEVLGKNPIWVLSRGSGEVRTFMRFDKGKMSVGDRFCVSAKEPIVFTLKRSGFEGHKEKEKKVSEAVERGKKEKELADSISCNGEIRGDEDFGLELFDVTDIDPVKAE